MDADTNTVPVDPLVSLDVDQTYGEGVTIKLKPGMAWALYSDEGPSGPCGQSVRAMSPRTVLMTWPNEAAMRSALEKSTMDGKKKQIKWGVVDEYTAGGIFRVIQSG